MWSNLPSDLLGNIFSFLSPDSLARAMPVCRHWHTCATHAASPETQRHHPAWLVALPTRSRTTLSCCYVHNPVDQNWHRLSLNFSPTSSRAVAAIAVGGLILFRTTTLQLAVANPFTSQFRHLPMLSIARTNPAVGVIELNSTHYRIYVAGGMSDAPSGGGSSYESTLEMYDSRRDTWKIMASMPVEFAVRLTVWTPNESVYSNGVLYWMTSARAYSVMGFEIGTKNWRELSVPMADRLEFASLVPRNGKLALVGGDTSGGRGGVCIWIWELNEIEGSWRVIEKMPVELGVKFLGEKVKGSTKCVGIHGAVCLYKEMGSGMVVWRQVVDHSNKCKWEWCWIEGCCSIRGNQVPNFPIKCLLLHPNLSPSSCLLET